MPEKEVRESRRDWPVTVFHSHQEADEADEAFYASLTPQERLDIMVELVGRLQSGTKQGLARVYRLSHRSGR